MNLEKEILPAKKKRVKRPPEVIAKLILEAERTGNAAAVCRREGINPVQFYRWKEKFTMAGIQGLKAMKTGPQKKDPEVAKMKEELDRMKETLVDQTVELQLLKKSVSSTWREAL